MTNQPFSVLVPELTAQLKALVLQLSAGTTTWKTVEEDLQDIMLDVLDSAFQYPNTSEKYRILMGIADNCARCLQHLPEHHTVCLVLLVVPQTCWTGAERQRIFALCPPKQRHDLVCWAQLAG